VPLCVVRRNACSRSIVGERVCVVERGPESALYGNRPRWVRGQGFLLCKLPTGLTLKNQEARSCKQLPGSAELGLGFQATAGPTLKRGRSAMEASSSHSAGEHASVDAVDVAIVDHIRSAREKLGAALEDLGFKVHLPDDLAAWLDELRAAPPVVVIRLSAQSPSASESVSAIRQRRPGAVVVGLSSAIDVQICTDALGAGAAAILGPDAHSPDVAMAIREALDGHSVLPTEVTARMATRTGPYAVAEFTNAELDWLAALAGGTSADKVANAAGYSVRHFRRILFHRLRSFFIVSRPQRAPRQSPDRTWDGRQPSQWCCDLAVL